MADKTTTLKTKTNDNVYPNVIGDNRKNAFVDSSTITHHFYDQTHKVGFQINNETNIKIQNSLQKPAGLTKTKLVGVGTNGQENIEIGDNLTLANGKLSATGGGSGGDSFDVITLSGDETTYTGTITGERPVLIESSGTKILPTQNYVSDMALAFAYESGDDDSVYLSLYILGGGQVQNSKFKLFAAYYCHFITMTDSTNNIVLYITINNSYNSQIDHNTLVSYLSGKKVSANGNLHGVVPTYIAGEGGVIKIYYRTPGDNNINPTPDEYQDLSSFTITDLVTPVE